jgi:hypothetical protein
VGSEPAEWAERGEGEETQTRRETEASVPSHATARRGEGGSGTKRAGGRKRAYVKVLRVCEGRREGE